MHEALPQPLGSQDAFRWESYDDAWIVLDRQRLPSVPGGAHWGGGVMVSARDLARLGQLLLDGGTHQGRALLPAEWVRRMAQPVAIAPFYSWLARPLWDKVRQWLELERRLIVDGGTAAAVIDYTLNHWKALTRHLDDGAVPIDNNHLERQIKPWAMGRKAWMFVGSEPAGQRAAMVMSLVQSARLNGHDPFAYLSDVLRRLPTQIHSRMRNCCRTCGASREPATRQPEKYRGVDRGWRRDHGRRRSFHPVRSDRRRQPQRAGHADPARRRDARRPAQTAGSGHRPVLRHRRKRLKRSTRRAADPAAFKVERLDAHGHVMASARLLRSWT